MAFLMPIALITLLLVQSAATSGQRPAPAAKPGPSPLRTIYVSALDAHGVPVADLVGADFTVEEDGHARVVTSAAPAAASMQIALVVDDNGSGLFRYGLTVFVQQMQSRAEMNLSVVEGQVMRLVDYTSDVTKLLQKGLASLGPRASNPDGGQLLEGIFESARALRKREAERPVIVVLTVGGEEHSPLPAHYVLETLQQSGASLYVIFAGGPALQSSAEVSRPASLLEESLNLSEVLGDGPRQSGGRRQEIVASQGMQVGLQQIALELTHQYAVQYTRPDGAKAPQKVTVSATRRGVVVRAPTRVPKL